MKVKTVYLHRYVYIKLQLQKYQRTAQMSVCLLLVGSLNKMGSP